MKAPISWLKDYIDIESGVEELAEKITLAGLEVGAIGYYGVEGAEIVWERDKFFVARILSVNPHPDADRLVLAEVDYGTGQTETVVTGAPNLFDFVGKNLEDNILKSPLVLEGAVLFDGHKDDGSRLKLKGRKIRGIMNRHMLCSEKELGISDNHEGIILLDEDAPVGMPLIDYLGTAVLDIDLTPNLIRCASIIGIAREIGALTGKTLQYPDYENIFPENLPNEKRVEIETADPSLNPRFCAVVIEDVTIKPSPYWMQYRLRLSGIRPINNIVDISNYVMLETGQPNHAFDYDTLRKRADEYNGKDQPVKIITRTANKNETVTTLDDVTRKMKPFTILVTDPAGPLSIGGVMGGAESEIHENSQNVLLESAAWNFINIRRSINEYNLHSEAGYRFSRNIHPSIALVGALRGTQLIMDITGGKISGKPVDYYPSQPVPTTVQLPASEVKRLLGIELTVDEIQKLLVSLEFSCSKTPDKPDTLEVRVPDHRTDIGVGFTGIADLVEEIARIYGYDRIPNTRFDDVLPPQRDNLAIFYEDKTRDLLTIAGLRECITYRLTTPEKESVLSGNTPQKKEYVTLANPSSSERTVMRRSLMSSILEVVSSNIRHSKRIKIFEIGPIFIPVSGQSLPEEKRRLVIALSGPRESESWKKGDTEAVDFFDLKGIVEWLLTGLHITGYTFAPFQEKAFYPGRTAELAIHGKRTGILGQLHPAVLETLDIPEDFPLLAADIDFDLLAEHIPFNFTIETVPRFPAIRQDIAVVVDENVQAEDIRRIVFEAGGKLLADAWVFDVYRGEQVGKNKKSLAFALLFQAPDRTLTDRDAAKAQDKIVKRLNNEFNAGLRV